MCCVEKRTSLKLNLFVLCLLGSCKIWFCTILACAFCSLVSSNSTDFFRYKGPEFIRTSHEFLQNNSFSSSYSMKSEISAGLKILAKKFTQRLKEISEIELGVSHIEELIRPVENDPADLDELGLIHVKRLSRRLDSKLAEYLFTINQTITSIENFTNHYGHPYFTEEPCLFRSQNRTTENQFSILRTDTFQDLNLTEGFLKHFNTNSAIKLQFFISNMDEEEQTHMISHHQFNNSELIDNTCFTSDDPYFQKIFLNTVSEQPKLIVLIVDHGSVVSQNQISTAKSLAKHIISTLSFEDKVALFGLAETVLYPDAIGCSELYMSYATEKNKVLFINFIDSLTKFKGATNHSLGFQTAFNIIKHSIKDSNKNVTIIYISRGLLSSLIEAKVVMETISTGQDSVLPNVIINTCLLIDDGKTLFEKHFLRFVSQQNFTNYNIKNERSKHKGGLTPGIMEFVNSSTNFASVVRRLCVINTLHNHRERKPTFSFPHWDIVKKGDLVFSISQPVQDFQKNVLGIVGLDLSFEDVFEDFLYFNDYKNSYIFIIDLKGIVLIHPLLKQPNYIIYEHPATIDICYLETHNGFSKVRNSILTNNSGIILVPESQIVYTWQRIKSAPFVVVLVSNTRTRPAHTLHSIIMPLDITLAYHRLDLSSTDEYTLCWNLRQLSSLDTGSLFLSAWCFQSPNKYLSAVNNESRPTVQSYMAYLKDNTKLLANPGLKSGIRSDVIPLVHILPYWKKLFFQSILRKYIVRRYVATSSGALVMYPGAVIDPKLEPLKRLWYVEAIQHPDVVVLTPPYLDSGGAGYIVTISRALNNPATAVVAMDITLGYMYKLLVEYIPFCSLPDVQSNNNTKCFTMDDKGYLITHPNLIGKEMLEKQHITHMESLLANDMLNHKGFVQKLVCNDYSSSTIQRHYQFNMNGSGIISNMIPGDQCVRYHLIPLHGTNIFLGIINTTCDLVTAFCPCNTIDRHCLNCDRLEQSECECPCECPLDAELCGKSKPIHQNPPCFNYAEPPVHILPLLTKVKTCFQLNCEQYLTHSSCIGIIGCEWCQLQSDAITPLNIPFCTPQDFCFNGVLGSAAQSGDGSRRVHNIDNEFSRNVPVGSLGGGVVAFLLALALMFHCYLKHNQTAHRYLSADTSINLLNFDRGHSKMLEEPPTGANNGLVASAQEVALLSPVAIAISPYRMSTGYQRPPTGDSDHGYSTMTPHEDTEPPESQLLPSPDQTLLPHHILAPVTVHMVMDT